MTTDKTQIKKITTHADGSVTEEKDYRTAEERAAAEALKREPKVTGHYENTKINLSTAVSALAFVGMIFIGWYANAVDKDIEATKVVADKNAVAISKNAVAISDNASSLRLMIQVQQQQAATVNQAAEDAADNRESLIYLRAQAEAEARRRNGN